MTRTRKILLAVGAVLAVAVLLASLWAWRGWQGGRAQRSGVAEIPGLSAPVEVRWDAQGVPYCEAARGADLAAALGWLHANDRFTQMELGRRLAAGRLSELDGIGARALAVDRRHRTLRFAAVAEELWRGASTETRGWLEAYSGGVNAWLNRRGKSDLPPDLALLGGKGFRPEPWRPQDSLGFVLLMANDLSFWNDRPEETHFRWLGTLGEGRTLDLALESRHVPPEMLALAEVWGGESSVRPETSTLPAAGDGEPDGSPGSNNWVLGSSRTASGAPILANDPHLGYGLPGTWYQALLRSPDYEAAGMTLPGVPGVVIGRGRHVGWALTNVMLDDHDLFLEDVRPAVDGGAGAGKEVRRGDTWVRVQEVEETIEVAGGEAEVVTLYSTDRGPLLPAEDGLPARSLAWTLYETTLHETTLPETTLREAERGESAQDETQESLTDSTAVPVERSADPLAAFLGLARADSVAAVPAAIAGYVGPAQNLVAADIDGGLLWTVLGRVPDRRRGDGWLPVPGWDEAYGWEGLRPARENPAVRDPAADLWITANNRITAPGDPRSMEADYDSDHRARRIRQRLRRSGAWRVDEVAAVQDDRLDLYARDVVAATLESLPAAAAELPAAARSAADLLGRWNGRRPADHDPGDAAAGAPALFALAEREMRRAIFADEAAAHGLDPVDNRDRFLAVLRGEMDETWFDRVDTPEVEDQATVLATALAAAWRAAEERWGGDPKDWHYGDLQTLTLNHPLGAAPGVGGLFRRGPFPMGGSSTTVAAAGGRWEGDDLRVVHGASMRWVADLGRPDETRAALPAGQAGHPADPHYDDQTAAYLAGRLHPFPWSAEAIEEATVSRLRLDPASRSDGANSETPQPPTP